MRLLIAATLIALAPTAERLSDWMASAFYPSLLGILIIASLGVPIPEDVPLIAAGIVLNKYPEAGNWTGTLTVALIGIMSGDVVLYSLGRKWGRDVLNHRSVNWIVTPARYSMVVEKFHRRGTIYVFFGRFFMGIRGAMCIVAGATHFPFWQFFLADFAGALVSAPFFVALGYIFANALEPLSRFVRDAKWILLAALILVVAIVIIFRMRRRQKAPPDAVSEGAPATDVPKAADLDGNAPS